ncbi:hypothetical protein, partial [Sulfitobacter sp.]|uniref:hypothetical protein n=1 Tax=Sulfitobacter sp. TaxID=1903071 RepID=UPI0032996C72
YDVPDAQLVRQHQLRLLTVFFLLCLKNNLSSSTPDVATDSDGYCHTSNLLTQYAHTDNNLVPFLPLAPACWVPFCYASQIAEPPTMAEPSQEPDFDLRPEDDLMPEASSTPAPAMAGPPAPSRTTPGDFAALFTAGGAQSQSDLPPIPPIKKEPP